MVRDIPGFKEKWTVAGVTARPMTEAQAIAVAQAEQAVEAAHDLYGHAGKVLATKSFFNTQKRKLMRMSLIIWQHISMAAFKVLPLDVTLQRTKTISSVWGRAGMRVDFGRR
jgi:hypothetical protein